MKTKYQLLTDNGAVSVLLEDKVLIDIGVTWKYLQDYIKDIEVVLITHHHQDHLYTNTLYRLLKEKPSTIILCNEETLKHLIMYKINLDNVKCILPHGTFTHDKISFVPYLSNHDVECYAWYVKYGEYDILFSTDSNSVKAYPYDMKFDYLFIEYCYSDKVLNNLMFSKKDTKNKLKVIGNLKRHLSYEKAFEYFLLTKKKEGVMVPLKQDVKFMGSIKVDSVIT